MKRTCAECGITKTKFVKGNWLSRLKQGGGEMAVEAVGFLTIKKKGL